MLIEKLIEKLSGLPVSWKSIDIVIEFLSNLLDSAKDEKPFSLINFGDIWHTGACDGYNLHVQAERKVLGVFLSCKPFPVFTEVVKPPVDCRSVIFDYEVAQSPNATFHAIVLSGGCGYGSKIIGYIPVSTPSSSPPPVTIPGRLRIESCSGHYIELLISQTVITVIDVDSLVSERSWGDSETTKQEDLKTQRLARCNK